MFTEESKLIFSAKARQILYNRHVSKIHKCAESTYHVSFFLGIKFHRNIELTVFSFLPEFNRLKTETFKLNVNNALTSRKSQ